MGGKLSAPSDLKSPDYFYSKTTYNEQNGFSQLPKEILYKCIPLSSDLKIEKKIEEKKIKSFSKLDFQESTVNRMEEIFSQPGQDADWQRVRQDLRNKTAEKEVDKDEKLLEPLGIMIISNLLPFYVIFQHSKRNAQLLNCLSTTSTF